VSQLAEHLRRQAWQGRLQAAAADVEFWAAMLDLAKGVGALFLPYERAFADAHARYERLWLEYSLSLPGGSDEQPQEDQEVTR
jgi:hypothetical protein